MELVPERLQPPGAAILVIDVQNDYCHEQGALAKKGANLQMIDAMKQHLDRLLEKARQRGVPIIFIGTSQESATDSEAWLARSNGVPRPVCRANTWGAEFYMLHIQPEDIVILKHRYSAFINTRLDTVLRAQKINTLIVTGISTNVCVESTARDGFMLDYHIILVEDACAAFQQAAHDMTLSNIDQYFGAIANTSTIIKIWETTPLAGQA